MTIELLSDTLSGSGEGFGAVIDTDVQYDSCGIPYISTKRIKGSLRNSLNDLFEMPAVWKALSIKDAEEKKLILNKYFGERGTVQSSAFSISNFVIEDYELVKPWFAYLKTQYPSIFSNEIILSSFTNIRRQTKVDDEGIAEDHSLRTSRVVNKKLKFVAEITFENEDLEFEKYLALACANLKRIGLNRNRGLGEIRCSLEGNLIPAAISNFEKVLEGSNEKD
jgi:CRISPR-associated protein Csx10